MLFAAVTILGAIVLALLRMPIYPPGMQLSGGKIIPKQLPLTHMQMFASTIKLAKKQRMLVLSVVFLYTGLQLSFWSGIYPTCISFTQKLGSNTKTLLAMSTIMQGFGEATSGIIFGLLGTSNAYRPGRFLIVCFGAFAHLIAYIAVFVNFPTFAPLTSTDENALIEPRAYIAICCGFLLGFGDACWNTEIFAFLISKYPSKSAEAFSLLMFFQALSACISFAYSRVLVLHWHIVTLTIGAISACLCFCIVEKMNDEETEKEEILENNSFKSKSLIN